MEPTLSRTNWSTFIDLASPKIRDRAKQNEEWQNVKNYFRLKKCKQFQKDPYFSFLTLWMKATVS